MGKYGSLVVLAAALLSQVVLEAAAWPSGSKNGSRGDKGKTRKSWHGHGVWHRCFPDNSTKSRCFTNFPNSAHQPKSWLRWFMPQAELDSYVINDTQGMDTTDFVVSKIEQDPKQLCLYKDQFVEAMNCLGRSVKAKCPDLSDRMSGKYDRMAKGLTIICSRMSEMDSVCLHTHWESMGPCKSWAFKQMKEDFDHMGHRHHSRSPGHGASDHAHGAYRKNATGGGDRDGTSSSSSKGHSRRPQWPRYPSRNSTAAGAGNGTAGWKGDSGRWQRQRGGGNDTMENSKRAQLYCRFKYVMLECVKDSVSACHGPTAQIMHDFMLNMSDTTCRANMTQWEEAQVLKQVSDCHGDHCGAACRLSPQVPWLVGLLLALWSMLTARF
ncbi:uncharacterized protein LOC143275619 isoform X2 [Babylonia areolata]|uniref:uncharacterized protein LOC143275619 isoform X2 n=1 Tax=Babylonia areolata TaxID=304850 RepID=UPI003FD34AB6